ncbi:RNA polymerase sigma-70 factor [Algoriphagus vanfongensis]|uniref:RNA polymerase sigma factor n=1 Tax=Algoriphagus vanfongensis TaxID=426371 RepID=UPI00040536A3
MNEISFNSELVLISEISEGNEGAFRFLFDKYHQRVYAFCLKFVKNQQLAEDITQEIFIKLWQEKSKLKRIENCEGFLFLMVKRRCIDHLRKCRRDTQLLNQLKEEIKTSYSPIQDLENSRYLEKLKSKLSPQQLSVFELSREKGMTYQMISKELDISKNTVRNHMVEALKHIRELLGKSFFTFF